MSASSVGALVVTDVFPPAVGGSGELLANVYSRLSGVQVTVLAPGSSATVTPPSNMTIVRDGSPADVWGVLNPSGWRRHLRRFRQIGKLSENTHVVLHCGRAIPEGLVACARRILAGQPYVCWVHGEEIAYAKTSRELRLLLSLALRQSAGILANSHNTARELQAIGIPADRIVVVHPGVDANRFRPDAPGALELRRTINPDDAMVLLTVGRLQRRKGHDLVLEALGRLPTPHPSWRYVVVGEGNERQRLEDLAVVLGLRDRVTFAGAVPPEQLSAWYAAADIFVHPNRVEGADFEGFGIVFLEAAASGLPVIGGRSGGAPETVEENATALLVSGTDSSELAAAIADLLVDPERRRRMGQAGRERVVSSFCWERASALVKQVHERVAQAVLNGR